jgi:predicted transcriptional regulator
MSSLVVSTSLDEKIRGAASRMFTRSISKLIVVHKKKLTGINSRSDVIRLMAEF